MFYCNDVCTDAGDTPINDSAHDAVLGSYKSIYCPALIVGCRLNGQIGHFRSTVLHDFGQVETVSVVWLCVPVDTCQLTGVVKTPRLW